MQAVYNEWKKEIVIHRGIDLIEDDVLISLVDSEKYPHDPAHTFN